MKRQIYILSFLIIGMALTSCKKVKDGEVIEDTYTGNVMVTSGGEDPAGDFTGSGDNGTYSFGWNNPLSRADVSFDITTPTGSMQMIIEDADKTEVLNKTRSAGGNDSFSGLTSAGTPGVWKVTMIFVDFNGDGSYSMSPAD
jgi:hypothetical protein